MRWTLITPLLATLYVPTTCYVGDASSSEALRNQNYQICPAARSYSIQYLGLSLSAMEGWEEWARDAVQMIPSCLAFATTDGINSASVKGGCGHSSGRLASGARRSPFTSPKGSRWDVGKG